MVELPPGSFLEELGIDIADLVPVRQFLLFAGFHDRPVGGAGDIAGVYAEVAEAREQFRKLRLSPESANRWGELVALDASGHLRSVCWFGRENRTQPGVLEPQTHRHRWTRRLASRFKVMAGRG